MVIETKYTPDRTRSAVVTIIFTVFALAFGDAIIKGASTSFTLWQIFVFRSAIVVPILVLMLKSCQSHASILPKQLWWTMLRSLMLTIMWIAYYASLPHINLSVAAAAYYTSPLFITIFAAVFLGEVIGKTGWLAIAFGFIGVLLVLQPRIEDFNWYALLPVSSAILYALSMILTRSHCKSENMLVLSLWMNLAMFIFGAVLSLALFLTQQSSQVVDAHGFLIGPWSDMSIKEWSLIGVLSVAILVGSIGAAYAYQNGAPTTIATFDFAYVAFAVLWGIVIFQEPLSFVGAVGMFLIVFAGILAVCTKVKHHDSPSKTVMR